MKKHNLTIKKMFVVVLAGVLFAVSVSVPTFSWFNRPGMQDLNGSTSGNGTGNALQLNVPQTSFYRTSIARDQVSPETSDPIAYEGNGVTFATYLYDEDEGAFADTPAAPATSGTVAAGKRVYYMTTISNTGTGATDQNVSLYIKNFTPGSEDDSNICVGTNVPVKSFKNYSMYGVTVPEPTKNPTNGNTKRVYFEPYGKIPSQATTSIYGDILYKWRDSVSNKSSDQRYYVCSGGSSTDIDANDGGNNGVHWTQMNKTPFSGSDIFYADIPWDDNKLYFTVADWNTHSDKSKYRTQTFSNLSGDGLSMTQSLLFYLYGNYSSDYSNAYAGKQNCVGANFAKYWNSATISYNSNKTQTLDLSLSSGDYQGTLTYSKTGSGFSLNTSTGVITSTGTGTGTVKYTVTSYYGDSIEKSCSVKSTTISNSTATIKAAPIVTNLLIPAGSTQDVYWFIQNGDEMYGAATASGTYTHEGIYLGM